MKRRTATAEMIKAGESLFDDPAEAEKFVQALVDGLAKEQALIVLQDRPELRTFPRLGATAWQPSFVMRVADGFKPGLHPLYEKGAFYSLDFSSVFAATAMMAIPRPPRQVLDMCSAPGGKGVFAYRAFAPEILVCNETIRKRTGHLIGNLDRCLIKGAQVCVADPATLSLKCPDAFELVIVDAPCSGQSLLAKGEDVPGCWTSAMIDMCAGRQRRILAQSAKCVVPGGHLLYMTCTYSRQENERVLQWFLREFEEFSAVVVPSLDAFRSTLAEEPCYRMFPQGGLGAGAFTVLLRRAGELSIDLVRLPDLRPIWVSGQERKVKAAPEPVVALQPRRVRKSEQLQGQPKRRRR